MNIPFKSKLCDIVDIKKRNEAFAQLTDEEKRKEIAYDALGLVLRGKLVATGGIYWDSVLKSKAGQCFSQEELQETIINMDGACHVCQRGAFMFSRVRLYGSFNQKGVPYIGELSQGSCELLEGFSHEDFGQMELEFENAEYGHPYLRRSKEKMINICCNVIANGNFNVNDRTDYIEKWNNNI